MKFHIMDLDCGVVQTLGLGQQIVIFQNDGGVIGWRGVAQILPERCQFICSAKIYFEQSETGEIKPTKIMFDSINDQQWWLTSINCGRTFEFGYIGCVLEGPFAMRAHYYL